MYWNEGIKCSEITVENCVESGGMKDECVICERGYFENGQGKCEEVNGNHCVKYKENSYDCEKCESVYYLAQEGFRTKCTQLVVENCIG